MSARGEIVESRLRPTICEAVEKAAASLDITGVRALRVLLHAGVTAYWPLVKAAPTKQIRAYEATVQTLRERWEVRSESMPDPVAAAMFREMDAEVGNFLQLCADRSGTQWLEPVDDIATYVVSVLQGAVLRWLADCNDETTLVVSDDLVSGLTTRAAEV
ncbi:TetR family transcriptional regulator [Nocardia bhagyanarayanae]|uniref:TetR family transcriptional regulator n=1 Tax=Nocardia bhagyanarayanae TaxID=1215925 RepID=UPI001FEA8CB4|nr:TetR family transcriptional regulator [Nocardia bhagyanarayanae]